MEEATAPEVRSESRRMRPAKALAITVLAPCLLWAALVLAVGDNVFIFTPSPPGREDRAALAIRDDVSPFYKWGTLLFTRSYLRRHYGDSWYFTQAGKGDCEDEFIAALEKALENHAAVDLYLLAHTNTYIRWVESFPEELRRRIRFVYNTGCHNEPQGAEWLALGADAYIGHPGVSQSPFFYFFLLRHWTRGATLDDVLELGNRRMERKFYQVEWAARGNYSAGDAMRESVASLQGNGALRLEDLPR